MERFRITVDRQWSNSKSITGVFSVNGKKIGYTLELPWLNNQGYVSCVPPGTYRATIRYDHSDRWRIQLEGVPGPRKWVQFHIGNFPQDSVGCILVGTRKGDNAVYNSAEALRILKREFYGTENPTSTPNKSIVVEIKGILSSPWGDFQGYVGGQAPA